MAATWADSAAARDAHWIVIARIEGWGNYSGAFAFCSQLPNYAAGNSLYRPWLMDWPRLSPEKPMSPDGGLVRMGELQLKAIDGNDLDGTTDALTREWRMECDPVTYLANDLSPTGTSLVLEAYGGATAGSSLLWLGNEALRVTAGAGPFTVTRAWAGTDAVKHWAGDPVYAFMPTFGERRLRLYTVPIDASSAAEERLAWDGALDDLELTDELGGYAIRGRTQLKWLSRTVARRDPYRYRVLAQRDERNVAIDLLSSPDGNLGPDNAAGGFPDTWSCFKNGDEIAAGVVQGGGLVLFERAVLDTKKFEWKEGDEVRVVYGADPVDFNGRYLSWFRNSPGPTPSTSRTSGLWPRSAHFIDLILNLATSSADASDGLELVNYVADGNWSCLPVGIGIGTPISQIDVAAARAVRQRAYDYLFPNFYVGDDPVEFGELISQHFLKPIGAYLSTSGGSARIILPRTPLTGSSMVTIGSADILRKEVARNQYVSNFSARKLMQDRPTEIIFVVGPDKVPLRAKFPNRRTSYYQADSRPLKLEAPSARVDADGRCRFLEDKVGVAKLLRQRRPLWSTRFPVDISHYAVLVGDLFAFTHELMPDSAAGVRGTTVVHELVERAPSIDPEDGYTHRWVTRAYGSNTRAGAIAPAAQVTEVFDQGDGTFKVDVLTNRFTQPDAVELPNTDAGAFAIGDILRVFSRAGVDVGGTTQTIIDIIADAIFVDGDFGGYIADGLANAGEILRYTGRDDAAAQQYTTRVDFADRATRTVGVSIDPPWKFGEV